MRQINTPENPVRFLHDASQELVTLAAQRYIGRITSGLPEGKINEVLTDYTAASGEVSQDSISLQLRDKCGEPYSPHGGVCMEKVSNIEIARNPDRPEEVTGVSMITAHEGLGHTAIMGGYNSEAEQEDAASLVSVALSVRRAVKLLKQETRSLSSK